MNNDRDRWALRSGAAALGVFAGAALGLALGVFAPSLAAMVFGGAAAGAATGLLFPSAAMAFVTAVVHFFWGMFSAGAAIAGDELSAAPRHPEQPWWVVASVFGAVYALAWWLLV